MSEWCKATSVRSEGRGPYKMSFSLRFEEMKKLYIEDRMSLDKVALIIGCSNKTVEYHLKKNGVHLRNKSEALKGREVTEKMREAARKLGKSQVGSKSPVWKGRVKRANGYIGVRYPDHPFSSKDGYVMEHRLVMEKAVGRYLSPDEDVHHINGIKDDNRLENLMLLSKSQHARFHGLEKIANGIHNNFIPLSREEMKSAITQGGTVKEIAQRLGIDYVTFYRKLDRNNLREWYKNWREAQ